MKVDVVFLPKRPMLNRMDLKYRQWIASRPQVFGFFERYALEALNANRRFGIALLCERVRWEALMTWDLDETEYGLFKITNQHRTYLARDLVLKHPALENLIRMKEVKYDDVSDDSMKKRAQESDPTWKDKFRMEQTEGGR